MAQRILVVEDEPAIADNIVYALETEGFEVAWCATGEDARRSLDERGAELIVLDVGLPDCNGFDLCKQIRKTSAVPIIFLTARTDEIDRVVGLEIGGDDYVQKPFSPRELAARVRAVLRRCPSGGDTAAAARVDSPFTVDRQRMQIAYFGKPLDLSRYEYRILEVLIGRPGWVFSRDKLMELAWEEPQASMERTVDTHVKTLRAKLREVRPEADPIRTHRGLGYSLKESW
ncbi:MAG: two-component system response regulator CreB [Candidatus Hydrogenedentes bacterium]|nr:two-component system response regulator CreB [Candidatus Hydrogenedentota bacterium]